ncbi:MAG: hypothetical protein KME46_25860 [Brasilonema angustatum HA4187-MV1]|jgi:hypothetical protein|nr:hypothetical protein [Brasilonema angustatum HA4187-MV1]
MSNYNSVPGGQGIVICTSEERQKQVKAYGVNPNFFPKTLIARLAVVCCENSDAELVSIAQTDDADLGSVAFFVSEFNKGSVSVAPPKEARND